MLANARNAIRECYTGQTAAVLECTFANARNAIRECYAGQIVALIERTIANARNPIRNRNAGQIVALIERFFANARNAIRECYAGQTVAVLERTIANARNATRDRYAGQTVAVLARTIANARNAIRDRNAGQTAAAVERILANARNAIRDRYAGQTVAVVERFLSNQRHRLPINFRRDHHFCIRTQIPCDRHFPVNNFILKILHRRSNPIIPVLDPLRLDKGFPGRTGNYGGHNALAPVKRIIRDLRKRLRQIHLRHAAVCKSPRPDGQYAFRQYDGLDTAVPVESLGLDGRGTSGNGQAGFVRVGAEAQAEQNSQQNEKTGSFHHDRYLQ